MKNKMGRLMLLLLSIAPFVITAMALKYFPEKIPTHYDFSGNIDAFGSKNSQYVLAAVFSISGLVMFIISECVRKIHNKEEEDTVKAQNNANIINKIGIGLMILFIVMQGSELLNVYYYINNKGDFPDLKITNIALMSLMVYAGNVIAKSKMNSALGIRTSWSFKSEKAWSVSQRSGGKAMIITSILMIIAALILPEAYQIILLFSGVILVTGSSLIVSYRAVKKMDD